MPVFSEWILMLYRFIIQLLLDVKSAHGSYYKATYRVSAVNEDYYDWQHDDEKDSKQDGYAGNKGQGY